VTGANTPVVNDGRPVATVTVTVAGDGQDPRRTQLAAEIRAYLARPRRTRPRAACTVADRTPRSGIVV
jgi:hypothetical protein